MPETPPAELSLHFAGNAKTGRRVRVAFDGTDSDWHGFDLPLTPKDREQVRWYVETYGAQSLAALDDSQARAIEARLPLIGQALFRAVFTDPGAAEVYSDFRRAEDRPRVLTIDAEDGAVLSLPWELLHDHHPKAGRFLFRERRAARAVALVRQPPGSLTISAMTAGPSAGGVGSGVPPCKDGAFAETMPLCAAHPARDEQPGAVSMETDKLGVGLKLPVSFMHKPVRLRWKETLAGLAKAAVNGAKGEFDDAFDGLAEAFVATDLDNGAGQLAWTLVYAALMHAWAAGSRSPCTRSGAAGRSGSNRS